jgi:2-(1,2-epoxy-1,2-dihydrophenyl)acetyl-CoA isomerase
MTDATLVERRDGLVTVTFNRPDRKNALNLDSWADLDRVLIEVWQNPDDRALLLTGAGGNFSSGADLSASREEVDAAMIRPTESTLHEMRRVNELTLRLKRLPKPTVAAVDGVAIGVAFGLAMACDLVVATDRAQFCAIFAKRGLTVDGGLSWSLPHIVGHRRAKQIALLAEMMPAREALEWGLVNKVVPSDELERAATEWARRLANGPTTALSLINRMIDASESLTFEQALEDEARSIHIVYTTDDLKEGMMAFIERREPRFTGS